MDGTQASTQALGFHQLDYHTIHRPGQSGNVFGSFCAFIGENRQFRTFTAQFFLQPEITFEIISGQRLFDKFQVIGRQTRNQFQRLFARPTGVGVHTQSGAGDLADGGA